MRNNHNNVNDLIRFVDGHLLIGQSPASSVIFRMWIDGLQRGVKS
jgi:hypothetical protein